MLVSDPSSNDAAVFLGTDSQSKHPPLLAPPLFPVDPLIVPTLLEPLCN